MIKLSLIDMLRYETDKNGKTSNLIYELPSQYEVRIGRGSDNDIVINGRDNDHSFLLETITRVSRAHCIIYNTGDEVSVMDKGSSNSTFINNIPIEPLMKTRLENRDILKLGFYQFMVKIDRNE